jgi:hypothetical protein
MDPFAVGLGLAFYGPPAAGGALIGAFVSKKHRLAGAAVGAVLGVGAYILWTKLAPKPPLPQQNLNARIREGLIAQGIQPGWARGRGF